MGDSAPEFESRDTEGTSRVETGTATTTATDVPTSAGGVIDQFIVVNQDKKEVIKVSMDGGTTFKTVHPEMEWGWTPKGNIKQLKVKTDANTADYEIVLNRET